MLSGTSIDDRTLNRISHICGRLFSYANNDASFNRGNATISVSSGTRELFDDADDVRYDAVNAMLHDIVGSDTNNCKHC